MIDNELQAIVEKIAYGQYGEEQIDDLIAKMGMLKEFIGKHHSNGKYEIGDRTPSNWEVVDKQLKYDYILRKRIKVITSKIFGNNIGCVKNEKGFCYFNSPWKWIELDNGNELRLSDNEFEYLE